MKSDRSLPSSRSSHAELPIALDAMGGDFGPEIVVQGAIEAATDAGIRSVIVGQEEKVRPILEQHPTGRALLASGDVTIHHAASVIEMDESPALALRGKADASIRVAFELVQNGGASAVVSPGNSGAVMAAGVFVSGTLPSIARPAIASLVPKFGSEIPTVLLDSGANVDCNAHQLVQFALMGSAYAQSILSIDRPRVALVSNGSESSKGNDLTRAAASLLAGVRELEFIGYIEGRDLGRDVVDVAVCDGFVGNVVLKTMEGTAALVFNSIRVHVRGTLWGRLGLWLARPALSRLFRDRLDPSSYGGAPLLGLNDVAIVCHGASGRRAIKNGLRVARRFVDDGLVERIRAALASFDMATMSGERSGASYREGMWGRVGDSFARAKVGAARGVVSKELPAPIDHHSEED